MAAPPGDLSAPLPGGDPTAPFPVRVLVDSCVFPRNDWMYPIVDATRAGLIQPLWSQSIISEATRVLAHIWFKRHPEALATSAGERQWSAVSKRWLNVMNRTFEPVDDRPPYDQLWTGDPRDPDDVPIWTAARRGNAAIVVTHNLKDGPPADEHGVQSFDGIIFFHPDTFLALLTVLEDQQVLAGLVALPDGPGAVRQTHPTASAETALPAPIYAFLSGWPERAALERRVPSPNP